jgi:hypothetical protein
MRLEAEGRSVPHALEGSIAAAPATLIKSRRFKCESGLEPDCSFFIVVSEVLIHALGPAHTDAELKP